MPSLMNCGKKRKVNTKDEVSISDDIGRELDVWRVLGMDEALRKEDDPAHAIQSSGNIVAGICGTMGVDERDIQIHT